MKRKLIPDDLPEAVSVFLARLDGMAVAKMPGAYCRTKFYFDGRIVLEVPPEWDDFTDEARRELLCHECGHWAFGHHLRCGDRNPQKFNVVCDMSISENGIQDTKRLAEMGFNACTFEQFGLPVCPPEVAYDMLPDSPNAESCGSISEQDLTEEQKEIITEISTEVAMHADTLGGKLSRSHRGGLEGEGSRHVPDLPPPPAWIRQVCELLSVSLVHHTRDRTWKRESRIGDILPGRLKVMGIGARFLIDASGSIEQALLGKMLSAIVNTPELVNSDVVVFDHKTSGIIPAYDQNAIFAQIEQMGGGTCIAGAGAARDPSRPAVWLTDGFSGDGWPEVHSDIEIWVISQGGQKPPREIIIDMVD